MSAKNVKSKSIPGDKYYTPRWCVEQIYAACLDALISRGLRSVQNDFRILDPAAGRGIFLDVLREKSLHSKVRLLGADIDKTYQPWKSADESRCLDFLADDSHGFDLIIGNPPFSLAAEFVLKSIADKRTSVAFLLRNGFLVSAKRYTMFAESPPSYVYLISNRPSFTGDGRTDSTDYCWVVWDRTMVVDTTELYWLPPVSREVRNAG